MFEWELNTPEQYSAHLTQLFCFKYFYKSGRKAAFKTINTTFPNLMMGNFVFKQALRTLLHIEGVQVLKKGTDLRPFEAT